MTAMKVKQFWGTLMLFLFCCVCLKQSGVVFKDLAAITVPYPANTGAVTLPTELHNTTAHYLKIVAQPYGKIPAGNNAYLFVDEVIVE